MFKDRLRATRISRGYTAQVLADHLEIGLRNYQKYESGDARPTFEGLVSLSDFLNVPIDFLLGRDDFLKSLGVSVDVSLECPPRRPRPEKNL
ncbi:MAG: helix-turn-helix transcriptional regulator [Lachnospiraceae bacterium]|nr:helix-turn-helix transcriptional regulator [Lachnospiraceae bacterium]